MFLQFTVKTQGQESIHNPLCCSFSLREDLSMYDNVAAVLALKAVQYIYRRMFILYGMLVDSTV